MICKIEKCGREAAYKSACLCQKHYFRLRRNGDFELHTISARPRYEDDRGYQFIHAPSHPLCAKGQSYVGEHRMVLYEAIGPGPMQCELCGVGMTWKTCQSDHIDEDTRNNERGNLRPLCRRCNTWRSMPPAADRMKSAIVLTFNGETKTAQEWSKDPRVNLSGGAIRHRKRRGLSDEECLFGRKITHNGSVWVAPRKTQEKHERSNAVAIIIDGVTKTAAEWARCQGVTVGASGIVWRIRNGWEPKNAVFQKGRFA